MATGSVIEQRRARTNKMLMNRFFLLMAGHILGQHLPSFSTELVSSNYQLEDLRLQHCFPSKNKFGGHGAFSTIALTSPTSQTTPPKVPTAFIPYEVNSTEKLGLSLTATWQAVTVDYGGDSMMTFTGETSEFETTAFVLLVTSFDSPRGTSLLNKHAFAFYPFVSLWKFASYPLSSLLDCVECIRGSQGRSDVTFTSIWSRRAGTGASNQ